MWGLLVIDLQRWFFRTEERRTALPELLRQCHVLSEEFRRRHLPVVHIRTELPADDRGAWPLSMRGDREGVMLQGTDDVEPYADVPVEPPDTVVTKTRHSAFIRTPLENNLRQLGVTNLVLSGCFVDGCVGLSAVDAYERDFRPILAADASIGLRPRLAEAMLAFLREEFLVYAQTTEQLVAML